MHGRNLAVGSHNDRHVPDRRCPGALRAPACVGRSGPFAGLAPSPPTGRAGAEVALHRLDRRRTGQHGRHRVGADHVGWRYRRGRRRRHPHAVRRRPVRARHHPVRLRLHLPVWALPLGAAHREGSPQPDVRAAHRALVRFLGPHPIRPGHQPGQHRHPDRSSCSLRSARSSPCRSCCSSSQWP